MLPFVDIHCHLLPRLDDGPRSSDEAVAMCQMALAAGTHVLAATSHQSEQYPRATCARIREKTQHLSERLHAAGVNVTVYPSAEVALRPGLVDAVCRDEVMTVGDSGKYLLLELPTGLTLDCHDVVRELLDQGIVPILAHAERFRSFILERERLERLVALGCLVQINAGFLTTRQERENLVAVKRWIRDGLVHLIGSDGHSTRHRQPVMTGAYERISGWAGPAVADQLCSTNGLSVLRGLPLRPPAFRPQSQRRWFGLFG